MPKLLKKKPSTLLRFTVQPLEGNSIQAKRFTSNQIRVSAILKVQLFWGIHFNHRKEEKKCCNKLNEQTFFVVKTE